MKYLDLVKVYDYDHLSFVARAVGKDEDKPQFWYMKITEEEGELVAVATDGKRLHMAKLPPGESACVSPGFWQVLKNKIAKIRDHEVEDQLDCYSHNYLAYEKENILWLAKMEDSSFFPEDEKINKFLEAGRLSTEGVFDADKNDRSKNRLIKALPESSGIKLRYLKDLAPHEWSYKIYSGKNHVLFSYQNKTAVIATTILT
jgi:hypothetical protein